MNKIVKLLLALVAMLAILNVAAAGSDSNVFGVITDNHCPGPECLKQIGEFTAAAKDAGATYLLFVGDQETASGTVEDFQKVVATIKKGGIPAYFVLGNHDIVAVGKQWPEITGMPGLYYSKDFKIGDTKWRLIGLNTQSHMPPDQYNWLDQKLDTKRNVIIVNHHTLYGGYFDPDNSIEIRRLFKKHGNVVLVIGGHSHQNYEGEKDKTVYLNLPAARDKGFGIVSIGPSTLDVKGYYAATSYDDIPVSISTPVPTPSPSPIPTPIPSPSSTPVPTPVPTVTANITPETTATPSPTPTSAPTINVTATPTTSLTVVPTVNATPNITPETNATPLPAVMPSPENLVLNPDLELGSTMPVNWTFVTQSGNTPSWDNVSHSGSKSVRISVPGTANVSSGYPQSDIITAQPLTTYIASVWGKTQNTGGANTPAARVVELDANKKLIRQTNIVPVFGRGTNDWTQRTIEFKTDANTRYLYVYANIWNGYGDFWMDDVVLTAQKPD